MAKQVTLEILTPDKELYRGEIESLVVKTPEGYQGFLAGRAWTIVLLAEDGDIRFREPGGKSRRARIGGGYVDITDKFMIFAESAEWIEE